MDEHAEERFELLARYERTATAPLFKQIVSKVLGGLAAEPAAQTSRGEEASPVAESGVAAA